MTKKYAQVLFSEKIKGVTKVSDACQEDLIATGNLYYDAQFDQWLIEFLCSPENGLIKIWSADTDVLTKQIASEILGNKL